MNIEHFPIIGTTRQQHDKQMRNKHADDMKKPNTERYFRGEHKEKDPTRQSIWRLNIMSKFDPREAQRWRTGFPNEDDRNAILPKWLTHWKSVRCRNQTVNGCPHGNKCWFAHTGDGEVLLQVMYCPYEQTEHGCLYQNCSYRHEAGEEDSSSGSDQI